MHKLKFQLLWLMVGYFLWELGNDLFAITPKFRIENIWGTYRILIFIGFVVLAGLIWFGGMLQEFGVIQIDFQQKKKQLDKARTLILHLPRWVRIALGVTISAMPTWILLFITFKYAVIGFYLRLSLLIFAAIIVSFLWQPSNNKGGWEHSIFTSILLVSSIYFVGNHITLVSPYPFSIGWSEGNRLWDYSVWLGIDRYLLSADREIEAFISNGKLWISGFPFIIPGINIIGVRFWVALMKFFPTLLLGYLAFGNTNKVNLKKFSQLLFSLWVFLFLLQGPIQYSLIIAALITVLGVRQKNLAAASLLVMLAGYFSEISRFTWIYAPGLWAGMIVLMNMHKPSLTRDKLTTYYRLVAVGFSGYFGGQFLGDLLNRSFDLGRIDFIKHLSEEGAFNQELLWERLLPNTTFSPGILLALLFVILPLFVILLFARRYAGWKLNKLQLIGISIPLLAFLVVGIIASTKIGGGADLHNLDMFLVGMVLVIANGWDKLYGYLIDNRNDVWKRAVLYLALLSPIVYSVGNSAALILPPIEKVNSSLVVIREAIAEAKHDGEILFMDQRQLLTFGYIEGVILVDEYEKKLVMDMALANNEEYFTGFYEDLANHRFSIIISEPLYLRTSDFSGPFPEENDAWVTWVSNPLLKYYRVLNNLKAVGVQILVPRTP